MASVVEVESDILYIQVTKPANSQGLTSGKVIFWSTWLNSWRSNLSWGWGDLCAHWTFACLGPQAGWQSPRMARPYSKVSWTVSIGVEKNLSVASKQAIPLFSGDEVRVERQLYPPIELTDMDEKNRRWGRTYCGVIVIANWCLTNLSHCLWLSWNWLSHRQSNWAIAFLFRLDILADCVVQIDVDGRVK